MNYYFAVLSKYATFKGRARRAEYWYFCLFNTIISIFLLFISEDLQLLYNLAMILPFLAVAVRRMHDIDKSGWFILVPIYNYILACTEGDPYSNKFGVNPKI